MDPVLLTISPSWISLHKHKIAVSWQSVCCRCVPSACRGSCQFFNLPIVAQDDNTDVVRLQVESHALDSRLELHHLTGLHLGETEDSGNTITDGDNGSELHEIVDLIDAGDLGLENG